MTIPIYQVDAFTSNLFGGNPAAVCPLDDWLPDETLQAIAAENNLSETAFVHPGDSGFDLRWFTPAVEVDLCGHATLAAFWVLGSEGRLELEDGGGVPVLVGGAGNDLGVGPAEVEQEDWRPRLTAVGSLVATRAKAAGVDKVKFDRGPYKYHGRVKELAQAAREGGLVF